MMVGQGRDLLGLKTLPPRCGFAPALDVELRKACGRPIAMIPQIPVKRGVWDPISLVFRLIERPFVTA